jgi:hypothetical protein
MIMSNVSDKLLEAGISIGYGGSSTINYAKLLSAVKEIAEQSYNAGVQWQIGNHSEMFFDSPNQYLPKEQFIKQLFGEEEI